MITRRNLIIVAVAIVVLGLGVLAYFYFSSRQAAITVSSTPTLPAAGDSTTNTASTSPSEPVQPVSVGRLIRISAGPIVPGEVALDRTASTTASAPTGADVEARFIERESGNVFSYLLSSSLLTRTSNHTIPGIEEAAWTTDGVTAFVRYLSGTDFTTINTYTLAANGSTGTFLAQNLAGVSTFGSSILTVTSGAGGSIGSVAKTGSAKPVQVFSTPLSSIRASFAGKSQYLVFTKPSVALDGYAFLVDAKGNFSRIAGPLFGLGALASPTGKWILVSYVENGTMKMELIATATHETIALPVGTIADKCAWTADESAIYCGIPQNPPSASYPDDWYQGAVHFSDRIWKIDVSGRFAELALDFSSEESGAPLDATALALDPASRLLLFVNKNDGALWGFKL